MASAEDVVNRLMPSSPSKHTTFEDLGAPTGGNGSEIREGAGKPKHPQISLRRSAILSSDIEVSNLPDRPAEGNSKFSVGDDT